MSENDDFFVGWSNHITGSLARFLAVAALVVMVGFAAVSTTLSSAITDPARSLLGAAGIPDIPHDVTLRGVLTSSPYPLLATAPDAMSPAGHRVMLVGDGKHAAAFDRSALEGRTVEIKGLLLKRGTLDMVVISDGPRLVADSATVRATTPVPQGKWRVVGEICDGKCGAGIMSPGTGIAHKACANLCIIGGVPPVLVAAQPLQGHQFLMISDLRGQAIGERLLHFIGMRIEVEGDVELRGDMPLMRIAPGKLRRL